MREILRGLTEHEAATDPSSSDHRIRGRTYAIPFDDVWTAATSLASGQLRGWTIVSADDRQGVIEASATMRLFGIQTGVHIDIGLDENAQTRVDAHSITSTGRGDLGHCRRIIGAFFRALDERLHAKPNQILDATRSPAWHAAR